MAYFECVYGGAIGASIPLVVTCTAGFAGQTISCSDGTTTLTDVCPSSSPYEITFNLPNVGTWTVSGTISGTTYTESILVQDINVELKNNIDVSVDVYSAANDTVSYVGLDGQSHTITTDSDGHATATITIVSSGSSLTFVSSVADDPENLSDHFSKTIALTSSTSSIYIMPVDECLYWYGYESANLEDVLTSNGWTSTVSLVAPTRNTNSLNMSTSTELKGVGTKNPVSFSKYNFIATGINLINQAYGICDVIASKTISGTIPDQTFINQNTKTYYSKSYTATNYYIDIHANSGRNATVYALWYE